VSLIKRAGLPLYTTNPADFTGLDTLIRIIAVTRPLVPHERAVGSLTLEQVKSMRGPPPDCPASTGASLPDAPLNWQPGRTKCWSDNLCHYRLHDGESMHSQIHP
jgi:hypothetical protein